MKRIIAVLLIFSLLCGLTGCATKTGGETPVSHDWNGADTLYPHAVITQPLVNDPFAFEQGALITTETQLHYLDFASGQLVPFCFRPNCQHNSEDCNSMRSKRIWSFVANNKFYYLDGSSARAVYDDELESYVGEIDLYVSLLNGSDEKKVTSLRTDMYIAGDEVMLFLNVPGISQLVLYGDSAFIFYTLQRSPYSIPEPGQTDKHDDPEDFYGHFYVTEIDLKTDKVVRTEVLNTGYSPRTEAVCAYGGGIYLWLSQYDEPVLTSLSTATVYFEGEVLSVDEYFDVIRERLTETNVRYDIVTGEMEPRDNLYPDEYGGPLVGNTIWDGRLLPYLVLRGAAGDWCIVRDADIKAYNMATGEVQSLYENIPEEVRGSSGKSPGVRQVGDGTLLEIWATHEEKPKMILYDLETKEFHELGNSRNEAGEEIFLSEIFGQNGNFLYGVVCGMSSDTGGYPVIGYGRFDVSDGYDRPKFEMMLPV